MNQLIVSLAAALSLVPVDQAVSPLGADAASFDALLENAYLHHDVAFVDAAVADDVSFAVDPDPNAMAWTKRQLIDAVRRFDEVARNVDAVRVEEHGDIVLTRGHIQVKTAGADGTEYQVYYIRVYRRGLAGWQLLSHQTVARTNGALTPSSRTTVEAATGSSSRDTTPPGVVRAGNGVTMPRLIRDVKPQYTSEAMKAKIQGAVLLEVIVNTDGTVGNVKVVRSLDAIHGLDEQAINAAKAWRFAPGSRDGAPVPVLVTIEMAFTLAK